MAHYEENLANPPLLDGTPDRAPIEGAFLDCIPSASMFCALPASFRVSSPPLRDAASRPSSHSSSLPPGLSLPFRNRPTIDRRRRRRRREGESRKEGRNHHPSVRVRPSNRWKTGETPTTLRVRCGRRRRRRRRFRLLLRRQIPESDRQTWCGLWCATGVGCWCWIFGADGFVAKHSIMLWSGNFTWQYGEFSSREC